MTIRKNAVFMALYEIAIYLAPFITAPYIARVLGTYGTGVYSYTYSIATYFVVLIQLGVSIYGRREIASCLSKDVRSKTFWGIWTIETIMFVVSTFLYICFVLIYDTEMKAAFFIQIFLLLGAWLDISWLYFGVENFAIAVSRNIIVKVLSLFAVFIFVKSSSDINRYVFIMAFSNFLGVVVMWFTCNKYISFINITKCDITKHIRPLFKLFIPVLSVQLYALTDKVFLGFLTSVDDVGIYENAYKISRVPVALITTLGTVMLPRVTKMISEGKNDDIYKYINKSLSLTMFIGIGCSFGLIGIAPTFIPLYLGDNFSSAIILLQILSILLIAIAWGNAFRNQFILPKKMDDLYLKSVLFAAILNIGLNCIFIPGLGATGAAAASVVSEVVICVYQSFKIRKYFKFGELLKSNFKYLIAGGIMLSTIFAVASLMKNPSRILLVCVEIIVGGAIYVLISCLLEIVSKQKTVVEEFSKIFALLK